MTEQRHIRVVDHTDGTPGNLRDGLTTQRERKAHNSRVESERATGVAQRLRAAGSSLGAAVSDLSFATIGADPRIETEVDAVVKQLMNLHTRIDKIADRDLRRAGQ